jgi:hypothetical protein
LVFLHGLGGSAIGTWTHPASNTFWPTLLHQDERFANVRIATFGYDAEFKNPLEPTNALGISEFAKQLLDGLDLFYDRPDYGDVRTFVGVALTQAADNICRA